MNREFKPRRKSKKEDRTAPEIICKKTGWVREDLPEGPKEADEELGFKSPLPPVAVEFEGSQKEKNGQLQRLGASWLTAPFPWDTFHKEGD